MTIAQKYIEIDHKAFPKAGVDTRADSQVHRDGRQEAQDR